MDYEARIKAYRFVAYSTVSFSVISLLSVCFTLPMLQNYVSNVAQNMDRELSACQGSAKDIWSELVKRVTAELEAQCPEEAEAEGLAANVVLAEDRAQPDPRDRPATPETREPQDRLDSQESLCPLPVNRPLRLPANRALVVNPDSLGLPDRLDNLEGQDSPETPAEIPSLDLPDPLDHLETREDPANPEDLVSQDSLQHQRQLAPLLLARLERLEPRDSLETPARPANPEDLDSPAPKDPLDLLASPETTDSPDSRAALDSREEPARRASVPSTVPSTAESSSRTAPEDARHLKTVDEGQLSSYLLARRRREIAQFPWINNQWAVDKLQQPPFFPPQQRRRRRLHANGQ
uniref:Nematode cuticle collagen N-terminal domain-containing protein n=1 Tax=Globodera rostochiensis TaxID=31243 RepID=A0A914GXX9_GLORO